MSTELDSGHLTCQIPVAPKELMALAFMHLSVHGIWPAESGFPVRPDSPMAILSASIHVVLVLDSYYCQRSATLSRLIMFSPETALAESPSAL